MRKYFTLYASRITLLIFHFLPTFGAIEADHEGEIDTLDLTAIQQTLDSLERIQQVEQVFASWQQQQLKRETTISPMQFFPLTNISHKLFKNRLVDLPQPFPHRTSSKTDYIPALLPLATTWALHHATHLTPRSQKPRLYLSNTLAIALTASLTSAVKHTIHETRPDQQDRHSYVSGHAAVAYMSATILHREFGHHSPWISVAGYGTAATTQYLRIHHHAHYMSDLTLGAAIGTVSTHTAYYLTDCILNRRFINPHLLYVDDLQRTARFIQQPTSLSLFSGSAIPLRSLRLTATDGTLPSLRTATSITAGLQYSYFFNIHWALDTQFRLSTYQVKVHNSIFPSSLPTFGGGGEGRVGEGLNLTQYHTSAGLRYSHPLTLAHRIDAHLHLGHLYTPAFHPLGTTVAATHHLETHSGIDINLFDNEKYVVTFTVDYARPLTRTYPDQLLLLNSYKILL